MAWQEGLKPRAASTVAAWDSVSPTTLGTLVVLDWVVVVSGGAVVVGDGPDDTTIVTVEPLAALAPAAGDVLMTKPAWTVSDAWVF